MPQMVFEYILKENGIELAKGTIDKLNRINSTILRTDIDGTIKIELYPEYAPNTVSNIIKLAEKGILVIDEFDKIIGIDKLACIHINDSKNIIGANKDRHENVGYGEIGFDNLIKIIYNERLKDIPKIL